MQSGGECVVGTFQRLPRDFSNGILSRAFVLESGLPRGPVVIFGYRQERCHNFSEFLFCFPSPGSLVASAAPRMEAGGTSRLDNTVRTSLYTGGPCDIPGNTFVRDWKANNACANWLVVPRQLRRRVLRERLHFEAKQKIERLLFVCSFTQ